MAQTYRITGMTDLKVLRNNSGSVQDVDFHFAKACAFKSEIKTITFEGDGSTAEKYFLNQIKIDIETDSYNMGALATVFGKSATTGISGVAKRQYWGANADAIGAICGVKMVLLAEDVDTGANVTLNVVAPRGTLSPPEAPDGKTADKSSLKMKFSSTKTTTDIAGGALSGVPADGCHWYLDEMS
jgi:hypothetical protein